MEQLVYQKLWVCLYSIGSFFFRYIELHVSGSKRKYMVHDKGNYKGCCVL